MSHLKTHWTPLGRYFRPKAPKGDGRSGAEVQQWRVIRSAAASRLKQTGSDEENLTTKVNDLKLILYWHPFSRIGITHIPCAYYQTNTHSLTCLQNTPILRNQPAVLTHSFLQTSLYPPPPQCPSRAPRRLRLSQRHWLTYPSNIRSKVKTRCIL
jgi:hypothetical protein